MEELIFGKCWYCEADKMISERLGLCSECETMYHSLFGNLGDTILENIIKVDKEDKTSV